MPTVKVSSAHPDDLNFYIGSCWGCNTNVADPYYHICSKNKLLAEDTKFTKHDDGKLHWDQFCWKAAAKVLHVMHHGAKKYGWNNWRKAKTEEDRRRYLKAAFRHMIDYAGGEVIDPDSGNPHLWHAACSLLFYLEYDTNVPKLQQS